MKQNKRIYESPTMEVVELKSRQTLLTGSTGSIDEMSEIKMIEEDD